MNTPLINKATQPSNHPIHFIGFLICFFIIVCGCLFVSRPAQAKTKCHMDFELRSWSVLYKSGKGTGTITCDNGEVKAVKIRTHGGGFTFGKQDIHYGKGSFTKVSSINDLYGSYAVADAHAGAKKSADAQAMTKGSGISLSLTGTGQGYNFGFAFGRFKISPKR